MRTPGLQRVNPSLNLIGCERHRSGLALARGSQAPHSHGRAVLQSHRNPLIRLGREC